MNLSSASARTRLRSSEGWKAKSKPWSVLIAVRRAIRSAVLTRRFSRKVSSSIKIWSRAPMPSISPCSMRHAKRLPKGLKPIRPGELVQIDTLFVNVAPDKAVKHFTAYDPVAKWTVALVAGRATARCAAALLDKLIAEVPFRIEGIQVDGGSEFRAEFEDAC